MSENLGFVSSKEAPILEQSVFKAETGQLFTRQLFWEFNNTEVDRVMFTLREYDIEIDKEDGTKRTIPSLYRLYIELGDITEYEFANKYFYSWRHWQIISNGNWFKEYIERWREELKVKFAAEALNAVRNLAKGDTRDSFQANKYLLDKGWAVSPRKGRPSKESVKKEAEELVRKNQEFDEDFKRMVVNMEDYRK